MLLVSWEYRKESTFNENIDRDSKYEIFSIKQLNIILTQIIDIVSVFGKPETIAENLSYIVHCLSPSLDSQTEWNYQNQIMLSFQRLHLGLSVSVDLNKIEDRFNLTWIEDKISTSLKALPKLAHNKTEMNSRAIPPLIHVQSLGNYKSNKIIENIIPDHVYNKIQKAEQIWDQREDCDDGLHRKLTRRELAKETMFINELHKVENKLDEPLDKDKRIYKQIILANAQDHDTEPIDYIKIQKRTVKNQLNDPDFEYKMRVSPYCQVCKKVLNCSFIDDAIPKDNDKVSMKDKLK